jgi:ribonuclease J
MLKLIPLGGLGEIGLNMMVLEYGSTILIVDAGLMFPEDYMLGVDIVIPDMSYIRQRRNQVSGIILTHAHEDHIGSLPYLLKEVNAPVFGTAFTLGIVRHKLEEHDLFNVSAMHEIAPGDTLRIGVFKVEFTRVGHSVVDGVGLGIHTPLGLIVHTGDFKINHTSQYGMTTDINRFARWGEQGVLALLSDSTNVEKEGYTISDTEIGGTLSRIIEESNGRIIVSLFASNISRIQQIIDISRKRQAKIVFDGRSIEVSVSIAKQLGYLQFPADMEIEVHQVSEYPDNQVVIVTTGSQGEPMSALARMASGFHKYIEVKKEDTIILSSKFIPGNEKAIAKIINNLYKKGANVIYEKIRSIHVSGHAFQEELKLMMALTKPRYFIPIHGEYRHLVLHARLAQQVGIPQENVLLAENGEIVEFSRLGARIVERIDTGRVLVDGKGIGDVGRSVLKQRRLLSEEGIVIVNMAFDEETGIVVYGPEIVSRGFVFETAAGYLLEDAKCVVLEIVEDFGPEIPNRLEKIQAMIQDALKKYFNFAIKRRPVILPFILEV